MVSNPEVYLLGNTHQYLSFVLFYVIKIDINYSFGLNSASKAFSSRANRICVAWWWCSGYSIGLATYTHGGNVTLVGWQGRQHCLIPHGTWVLSSCSSEASCKTCKLLYSIRWWANHKSNHNAKSQIVLEKDSNLYAKSQIKSHPQIMNHFYPNQIKSQITF